MSRYFFHLVTPDGREDDLVGSEFDDLEAAYLDASDAALEMCVELLRRREDPSRRRFEVTDAAKTAVFDLPFSEVMLARLRRSEGEAEQLGPLERAAQLREAMESCQALNHELIGGVRRASETVAAIRDTLSRLYTFLAAFPEDAGAGDATGR